MNKNSYYVYGLFYEDEEENEICFYIGSGKSDRSKQHFYESCLEETPNKHKARKIKKLEREDKNPYDKILVSGLTQDKARQLEGQLLQRQDVFSSITNISKKSFGFPEGEDHPLYGRSMPEKQKQKISQSLKGTEFSEKRKRAISEAKSGNDNTTEEQRRILSKVHSGREIEDWHKERISEANRGEKAPCSKLTEKKVREIKRLLEDSSKSQRDIASEYGITQSSVSSISTGETWDHV